MMSRASKLVSTTALVGVLFGFSEANAIEINGTFDANTLANELFLDSDSGIPSN